MQDSGTLISCTKTEARATASGEEERKIDQNTLQEWANKLKAADYIFEKVRGDVDTLKEANKKLQVQNGDLVRENLRLKAEVDNRSPQKFGRFTVAVLQAKVDQYEREINRLRKALERSDKYIEELERQLSQFKKRSEDRETLNSSTEARCSSSEENRNSEERSSVWKDQEECKQKRILTMRRSLSQMEQPSVSGLHNDNFMCSAVSCPQSLNGTASDFVVNGDSFSLRQRLLLTTASANDEVSLLQLGKNKSVVRSPEKDGSEIEVAFLSPCTPSTSLGCLQLNSPSNQDSPIAEGKNKNKQLTYLRKLTFNDCRYSGSAGVQSKVSAEKNVNGQETEEKLADLASANSVVLGTCQPGFIGVSGYQTSKKTRQCGEPSDKINGKNAECLSKTLQLIADSENNRTRTSSEASMDAAYLDKICELDSMMSESENIRSPCYSSKYSDRSSIMIPELDHCTEPLNESEKKLEQKLKRRLPFSQASNQSSNSEIQNSIVLSVSSPDSDTNAHFNLFGSEHCTGISKVKNFFQGEESSAISLFKNSEVVLEDQTVSTFSFSSPEAHPSAWASSFKPEVKTRSRAASHVQSVKRKSENYLGTASPSKTYKTDM
nr:PREDICTED: RING finger protein 219 isoform X2 [Latimeria chalumnae]|eukprot:XP_005991321.1 PREDICTED: RING finger protein 219 isoform X2 [Latimeria chalumnae]